ncbi:hypothetical protein QIS74_12626 [Colletotrichum tabaci]|uniref:Cysteine-rich transmembrane CYSTM domain-containing protein n=2 Tax=Colletotrichum destructivum species complex TaxID=2707350 RepID=A0AAV9SUH2_9PEZI|nr:hypothetical protein CDEST_00666 [Colletotrichum destructivum]
MSGQIEYNQMPREPAPAVLSERSFSAEQPRPNQPMTMDQTMNLRGGGGDGGLIDDPRFLKAVCCGICAGLCCYECCDCCCCCC